MRLSEAELWEIYKQSKGNEFFRPLDRYLALPPPDPKRPEADAATNKVEESAADDRTLYQLSASFGMLMASREAAFKIPKVEENDIFNPTELTASFIRIHLASLRSVVCVETNGNNVKDRTRKVVSQLAPGLAGGGLLLSGQLPLALGAIVLLILLKSCHRTFCDLTDEEVIQRVHNERIKKRKMPSPRLLDTANSVVRMEAEAEGKVHKGTDNDWQARIHMWALAMAAPCGLIIILLIAFLLTW